MLSLPKETIREILSFLGQRDRVSFFSTCHQTQRLYYECMDMVNHRRGLTDQPPRYYKWIQNYSAVELEHLPISTRRLTVLEPPYEPKIPYLHIPDKLVPVIEKRKKQINMKYLTQLKYLHWRRREPDAHQWPSSLTHLFLVDDNGRVNAGSHDKSNIPDTVTHLYVGSGWSLQTEYPHSLTHISIKNNFYLLPDPLPPTIIFLSLECRRSLRLDKLSDNLETLLLNREVLYAIKTLPKKLKHLCISSATEEPIHVLPPTLVFLELYVMSYVPITLPSSLVSLTINRLDLQQAELPPVLEYLCSRHIRGEGVYPPSLRVMYILKATAKRKVALPESLRALCYEGSVEFTNEVPPGCTVSTDPDAMGLWIRPYTSGMIPKFE